MESNGELYINASHVAIQTNTTISGVCTATNKVEIRVDDGTPARIDYYCEVSDSHYTRLQSAAHADYSGNVEVTLPVTSGKIIVGNASTSIDNNINTTGIITAASFYGDGSGLTGVTASGSGVVIQEEGSSVGTANTINFIGAGVTATLSGGIASVEITSTGGGGGDAATLDGIDSTSFLRSDAADIKTSGNLTFNDNVRAEFGTDVDAYIYHNNTNLIFDNTTGDFFIRNLSDDSDIIIRTDNGSGSINDYIRCEGSTGEVQLSHYGSNKLVTKSDGIDVTGHTETDTLNVSGVTTAANFRTNSTTGDGSDVGFAIKYYVTANGSSHYRFAGPGLLNTTDDPTIIVHRGLTYIFENSTGGSHPFRIQFTGTTIGVGTYLSGSQTGTQVFTIPMDAPATYEYQCTFHSGMKGTLHVTY